MDRVAYVVWTFPVLSQTFVVEELQAVRALGWDPEVVARNRPDPGEPLGAGAASLMERTTWLDEGSRRDRLRAVMGVCARHPLGVLRAVAQAVATGSRWSVRNLWPGLLLAARAERSGLSLLHVHFADDAGDIAWFAWRATGIPYVLTVHAVDIYMGRFLCRKLRDAALVVTVCNYNVAQISSRCPDWDASAALIKYAGVDTDRFRLTAPRPPRPGREILAVGRLVEKKGFEVLIDAVAQIAGAGREVHCRIVGDGPLHGDLSERIERAGLEGTVEIVGGTAPDRMMELYAAADLLAAPCTIAPWQDRDSMPVVIKEAMAMELPVVASDDFGIPELVVAGTGLLVRRDDASALADALRSVLDEPPEVRAAMGRAGRRRVETSFQEVDGARLLTGRWAQLLAPG